MTIQEAARVILEELKRPLGSKEIARIALDRHMVISNAKDPVQSHAQTIEKNIRDDVYNRPKLIFIHGPQGRLIGLPAWEETSQLPITAPPALRNYRELKANIPAEIYEKILLAEQAKLAGNFEETVTTLLKKGLSAVAPDIKTSLLQQLKKFEAL